MAGGHAEESARGERGLLRVREFEGIELWQLHRGRGNALDEKSLNEMARAFRRAAEDPKPIVLASESRSFCTGLDLEFAIDLDRTGMARLMRAFEEALAACYLHPAPVVAAVAGHALAGGALLALCCDRRILADRGCRFGIHGIHLGVSYPEIAIEVLRDAWPRRLVEELLYEGRIYEPQDALLRGLVDTVVPAEEVEQEAVACARSLASPSLAGFSLAKASVLRRAGERLARSTSEAAESWLDQWFSQRTRAKLLQARDALTRGEGKKPGELA